MYSKTTGIIIESNGDIYFALSDSGIRCQNIIVVGGGNGR